MRQYQRKRRLKQHKARLEEHLTRPSITFSVTTEKAEIMLEAFYNLVDVAASIYGWSEKQVKGVRDLYLSTSLEEFKDLTGFDVICLGISVFSRHFKKGDLATLFDDEEIVRRMLFYG